MFNIEEQKIALKFFNVLQKELSFDKSLEFYVSEHLISLSFNSYQSELTTEFINNIVVFNFKDSNGSSFDHFKLIDYLDFLVLMRLELFRFLNGGNF